MAKKSKTLSGSDDGKESSRKPGPRYWLFKSDL
jgi:hypothetical protein